MTNKLKLLGMLLLVLVTGYSQDYNIDSFDKYIETVNGFEEIKNYEEAIKLTNQVWNDFPDKKFELIKEMEYLNKKTNRYIDNLNLWKNGHTQGYFFLLNKQMKQYEPYLEYSIFDSLVVYDRNLRDSALKKSKSIYELFLPANYSSKQDYPLLIILHGGGSNIEKAKKRWELIDRLKSDFIIVFIQSYRHYDSKSYGWKSSDTRTHNDIKEIFSEISSNYSIDNSRIIIGGTSAGGTMALDLAFSYIIPVNGLIIFCPGIPKDFTIKHDLIESIKVYMLAGQDDYYQPKQLEMIDIFAKNRVDYRYKIIEGMGHGFPKEYEPIIIDALNFFKI